MAIYTVQTPDNEVYFFLRRICALRCLNENGGILNSVQISKKKINNQAFDDDLYD